MASQLDAILLKVLEKTTPTGKEKKHVLQLADELKRKVEDAARKAGVDLKVRVEGSIAKDTWLKEDPDIDIFMQVPPTVSREEFATTFLNIAREATMGTKQVERFAEHPYLEAIIDNIRINIVPCYQVDKDNWKSATDRTPFHTDYVKPLLNEKHCSETRLLKRFMKGIAVYGAEIQVGGFSGYLCELLVLYYGSFVQTLKAASSWTPPIFVDLEKYYDGKKNELKLLFETPLIIVDPIDQRRNAAAAVREEQLNEFIAASRIFLKNPSMRFFYPSETNPFSIKMLTQKMQDRGSTIVFIKFGEVKAVSDVLWGQLYKSQKALSTLLNQYDFAIIRNGVWSNEKNLNILLLEVKHRYLPLLKKHLGPPLDKRKDCEIFLRKHINSERTLAGPRLEEGRWVVEVTRKYNDVIELLEDKLERGGDVGIAKFISQAIQKDSQVLINEEISPTYLHNQDFAKFLTEYLAGKPRWLS